MVSFGNLNRVWESIPCGERSRRQWRCFNPSQPDARHGECFPRTANVHGDDTALQHTLSAGRFPLEARVPLEITFFRNLRFRSW